MKWGPTQLQAYQLPMGHLNDIFVTFFRLIVRTKVRQKARARRRRKKRNQNLFGPTPIQKAPAVLENRERPESRRKS